MEATEDVETSSAESETAEDQTNSTFHSNIDQQLTNELDNFLKQTSGVSATLVTRQPSESFDIGTDTSASVEKNGQDTGVCTKEKLPTTPVKLSTVRKSSSAALSNHDGTDSNISSDTEGPDTCSVVSESSETEGPDSDSFFSGSEEGFIRHDEIHRGMVVKQGEMVAFVADNLTEKIKLSSPGNSGANSYSERSSIASTPSGLSEPSPVDIKVLSDMESEAGKLAASIDKMMSEIHSNLHKMSAITVGCMQTYRGSVERTLNEVDSSIKSMYAFMARMEELNASMKTLYPVADQIHEIKKILDMFESQLEISPRDK